MIIRRTSRKHYPNTIWYYTEKYKINCSLHYLGQFYFHFCKKAEKKLITVKMEDYEVFDEMDGTITDLIFHGEISEAKLESICIEIEERLLFV